MNKWMTFLEFIEMSDPTDMGCGNQYICHNPEFYRTLVLQQTFNDYAMVLVSENEITDELKAFYLSEMKKTKNHFDHSLEELVFTHRKPDKKYVRRKLRCKMCKIDFYSSEANFWFKEGEIEGECYRCRMKEYGYSDYSLRRYFEGGKLFE